MKAKQIVVLGVCLLAFEAGAEEATKLKSERDRSSYAIGVELGRNFQKQELDVDVDLITKGIRDALSRGALLLPEKELRPIFMQVQAQSRRNMVLNRRVAAERNRQAGAAFLAENKAKAGVVTLPDGVQYSVIKKGEGALPMDADLVECNYRGNLLDGSEFDASEPGKPAHLKVSAISPPGWKETIKMMPIGSKWKIVVPASAAFGERGVGTDIGPNETLVFETEVLGVSR